MPRPFRVVRALATAFIFAAVVPAAFAAGGHAPQPAPDRAALLSLDCERLAGVDARERMQGMPAPRIVNLHGSVPIVTMEPFAEFLIGMGYPEASLRDPYDGSLTASSFADSTALAGALAWHYERDGLRPMLVGHSQGGMMVMRTLHELAGGFHDELAVFDPTTRTPLARTTIRDPYSHEERPVLGVEVAFAAAIATGKLPRVLLGQWTMIPKLRKVPDVALEFTGFAIAWDPIAGNFGNPDPYVATGTSRVRNVLLPATYSHIGAPITEHLPAQHATRAWIVAYRPGETNTAPPADADTRNLELAADLWYSIRRHWCLEGQRRLRAGTAAGPTAERQ
ncbi:MAG: hypothetical protein IT518_11555 [Burkholderiales bacterium]|nr:hypothetical protein [Burkholderiales bacterium]